MNLLIHALFEILIENINQFHESFEESFENFIILFYIARRIHCFCLKKAIIDLLSSKSDVLKQYTARLLNTISSFTEGTDKH